MQYCSVFKKWKYSFRDNTVEPRVYCEVKSLSRVRLLATLWTVAYQAFLSMEFSRQEYWIALPFPPPECIFFPFIFISWRLITLQYRSGFYHTLIWISREFTCIPHPNPPSHLPPHPIPLGHPSAPDLSTCLMHQIWTGDLFHNW